MSNIDPHRHLDRWLANLKAEPGASVGPCPDDEVLMQLAAGADLADTALRVLDHIVSCRACAERSKDYLAIFAEPQTEAASLDHVSRKPKFLEGESSSSKDRSILYRRPNRLSLRTWS